MKQIYRLVHAQARTLAAQAVKDASDGYIVEIKEATRSLEQNSKLWAALADVSKQVKWHGRMLSSEDWKHIFSSSLKKMDVVPNIEGNGFVVLGLSTSKMSKAEMSELLELIIAFGIEHDVKFGID